MEELTSEERQKLIAINQKLIQVQQDWAHWLDDTCHHRFPQNDYLPIGLVKKELVYFWDGYAPDYNLRPDHCAALFDVSRYHPLHHDQATNWNDFPDDENRPGGQYHGYWFHALYDHAYGSNALSWKQIAGLGGAGLKFKLHYEREMSLYDNEQAIAQRSEQTFALAHLNNTLADAEPKLKQALIEIDQAWLTKTTQPTNEWSDYELNLHVWLLVDEQNPRYTKQNAGELGQIIINATGVSQRGVADLEKLGDGKIHSPASAGINLNAPCCFLFNAFQQKTFLIQADYQYIDHLVFFAEVQAKAGPVAGF
ncbi:hypothetical protein [Thiomicrospira microaerophila]|uniref:hypothetical protein n=1 Tax=Thiomicrospira microaerophila TaxID=406020 RepID=UPI0005CB564A|nr:hypothetical protein [Thiomicrospira microaerophila]